jgi:hypothetical protein
MGRITDIDIRYIDGFLAAGGATCEKQDNKNNEAHEHP